MLKQRTNFATIREGDIPTGMIFHIEGGNIKGAEEMRLEAKKPIEKFIKQRERQAVKEFSEKLIRLVFDYLDVENAEQAEKLSLIDSTLTYDVILHAIDKLIEEEN